MSFAKYAPDGREIHSPAALDSDGKVMNAGYDQVEGVSKVAMMVWNPLSLNWERSTGGSGGSGIGVTPVEIKTKRIDASDPTSIYVGEAPPGTLESFAGWAVTKNTFDINGNPTGALVGSGSWASRLALNYL